jgi:hypothetical protein
MSNYSATYRKKTGSSFDNLYLETDSSLVENSDTTSLKSSMDYMYNSLNTFETTKTTRDYADDMYDDLYDIGTNTPTEVSTFYNNWINANSATYGNLRYIKDTRGYIYLYGYISTTSNLTDGMEICDIPCTVENTDHLFGYPSSVSATYTETKLGTTTNGKLIVKNPIASNSKTMLINIYFYGGIS